MTLVRPLYRMGRDSWGRIVFRKLSLWERLVEWLSR